MSDLRLKEAKTNSSALEVFERMVASANRHDLDGMVAYFSRDYQYEQPFHPERNFVGKANVRKNWGPLFQASPDMRIDVLSTGVEGDTIWAELHIHGTLADGKSRSNRGVGIHRIQDGVIVWARLYIESPSEPGAGR